MSERPFTDALEDALRDVDGRLQQQPASLELNLERGALLEALGHNDLARLTYAAILARTPGEVRTLNALGSLLYKTGARTAAQLAFAEAASRHPEDVASHLNLAYTFVCTSRFEEARHHYERALALDAQHPMAHQGLAYVLGELGDEVAAARHRSAGFREPIIDGTYRGEGEPLRVLLLCSALGGTVSTAQFLDERIFLTTALVVELFDAAEALPPHHVVFNAIGDADRCAPALARAGEILTRTDAPIVNPPDAVLATGRQANAARLGAIAGVRAPRMESIDRTIPAPVSPFGYPVLVRVPGYHTGRFFTKVDRAEDLPDALRSLPGDSALAIEYLDSRGADGKNRKYRAIIVDGELYPLHLAISNDWKIHYGTAQMSDAEHRAEEARFLAHMPAVLGPRVMASLQTIAGVMGLQFGGIDFGVDRAGNVLLYEANATMTVLVPEAHDAATYRRLPAERIVLAVMKMLARLGARVDRLGR